MIKFDLKQSHIASHTVEVKKTILRRIRNIDRLGYINKDNNQIPLSTRLKNFLNLLTQKDHLDRLVQLSPENLEVSVYRQLNNWQEITEEGTPDFEIVYNIFVSSAYKALNKPNFVEQIGIDTCPYCNRSYIYKISRNKTIQPEIDHFYPKSKYPLLGVSIYNLIPACRECNGLQCKSSIDPFIKCVKSPHLIEENDFQFTYNLVKLDRKSPLYNSKVRVEFSKILKTNSDMFQLAEFYEKHDDHVLELLLKSKLKYSNRYKKFLYGLKGIKLGEKELNRLIVSNYTDVDELHKRPLSKLYRDIAQELGLI